MGICKRIGKLITADIHGLLDVLEEPADSCKQAIREMEEDLAGMREEAKQQELKLERLDEQRKRTAERRSELTRQFELCVSQGDESLTRGVLKKKLEQEKLARFLEKQRETAASEIAKGAKRIGEYEERLASIKEKLACFSERASVQNPNPEEWTESLSVTDEEIEIALLQAKAARGASNEGRGA